MSKLLKRLSVLMLCVSLVMGDSAISGFAAEVQENSEVISEIAEGSDIIIEENSEEKYVEDSILEDESSKEDNIVESPVISELKEEGQDENSSAVYEGEDIIETEISLEERIGEEALYASYNSDWTKWNQSGSSYSQMRSGGCKIVASAKMIKESGWGAGLSNPDTFYEWGIGKGFYTSSSVYQQKSGAIKTYITDKGGTCKAQSSSFLTYNSTTVMNLLKQDNVYVILYGLTDDKSNDHYKYLSKSQSIAQGKPIALDAGGYIDVNSKHNSTGVYAQSYMAYTISKGPGDSAPTPTQPPTSAWYQIINSGGLNLNSGANFNSEILTIPYGGIVEYLGTYSSSIYKVKYWNTEGYISSNSKYIQGCSAPNMNPIGELTTVSTSPGKISITGWAFDRNDYSASLDILVYVNNSLAGTIKAENVKELDQNRYPGVTIWHGFNNSISTSKSGNCKVDIYAKNVGAGSNTLLYSQYINIESTVKAIDVREVKTRNFDYKNGTCEVVATIYSEESVNRVQFPTWTLSEQDDLAPNWETNTAVRGTTSYLGNNIYESVFKVKISDHSNDRGWYRTHVYAYNNNNSACKAAVDYCMDIPYAKPSAIGDASIIDSDISGGTYEVEVTFKVPGGYEKVDFATWTANDGQDDITWTPVYLSSSDVSYCGNDTYSAKILVDISAHNYERSWYYTHIYAYDQYGQSAFIGGTSINMDFVEVTGIHFICDEIAIEPNRAFDLNGFLVFEPANATEKDVTWQSIEFPFNTSKKGVMISYTEQEGIVLATTADGKHTAKIKIIVDQYASEYKEGLWLVDLGEYEYTGSAIKPEPIVYDGYKRLTKGIDYTVSYKNNVKANDATDIKTAPTVIVTGKGNYSGVEKETFVINQVSLTTFDWDSPAIVYNKKNQKPIPTLYWNGKKLATTNYYCEYYDESFNKLEAVKEPGTYYVRAIGKGNFCDDKYIGLIVLADNKLISKTSVSKIPNQEYSGSQITPDIIVKYGTKVLNEGSDYVLCYSNNIQVGKGTIEIIGRGEYAGEKRVNFNITGIPISKATVEGVQEMTFTGGDVTLSNLNLYIKATSNTSKVQLYEGTDYTLNYSNNVNAGTATVIINGINKYTGTIKKTFKIIPCSLGEASKKIKMYGTGYVDYCKGGAKPEMYFLYTNPDGSFTELLEGIDYTLVCSNNNVTGTDDVANAVYTFKKNIKGTLRFTYKVNKKKLSSVTVSAGDKAFSSKAGAYKSAVVLTDSDGKKLVANKDYDATNIVYTYADGRAIGVKEIVPAGSVIMAKVNAKDGSNYTGSVTCTYKITKSFITSAKISIPVQEYTGTSITPGVYDIKVTVGKTILVPGKDYEVVPGSYVNNVKKGTASVTIRGIGNYGGTKKVNFTIKAKGFSWWWR